MKNGSKKTQEDFIRFIKFGLVGLSNTVISYLINILVIFLFSGIGVSWDYVAGNIAAFIAGTMWSFLLNSLFVFNNENRKEDSTVRQIGKVFLVYGFTGILLNNVLSYVWITCLGISKYFAPIINLVITVPLNYFLNKDWVFKNDDKK